jgi:hypothetical protein
MLLKLKLSARISFVVLSLLSVLSSLSYASDGIKCGSNIISDHQWWGKVVDIYQNGDTLIQTNYSNAPYVVKESDLSQETECVDHFCKNDVIISDGTWMGSILKLFKNGDAVVQTSYNDKPYAINDSHLSKEVQCADGICKGDDILSDGQWTGTVLHIYGSGLAQIRTNYQEDPYLINASHLSKGSCGGQKGCSR